MTSLVISTNIYYYGFSGRAGACYQEKVYGSIDTRILDDGRLMSSATKSIGRFVPEAF